MTGLALVSEGPVTEEEIKGRKIEEEVKKIRGISVAIFPPTSCGSGWGWGKRPLLPPPPPPPPAKTKREGRKRGKKGELKRTKKEEEEKKG